MPDGQQRGAAVGLPVEGDLDKIKPGFEAALRAEPRRSWKRSRPMNSLIEWDCATEVQDAYGAIPAIAAPGA